MENAKRYKVLFADDDDIVLMLAKTALEDSGFELRLVETGSEVIPEFNAFQPDIVILDVNLPGRDGISICSEIRQLPHGKVIPVMMITGLEDEDAITRCLESGATDFESKPVNWLILGQKIRFLIQANDLYRSHAREFLFDEDGLDSARSFFQDIESLPSLDRRVIDNIRVLELGTGKMVLKELTLNFNEEIPEILQLIANANAEQDYQTLQSYIFYMQTKCGNIGAAKMNRLCKEMERLIHHKIQDALIEVIDELHAEHQIVVNHLYALTN